MKEECYEDDDERYDTRRRSVVEKRGKSQAVLQSFASVTGLKFCEEMLEFKIGFPYI